MKKCSFKLLKIGSWNIQGIFQKVNSVKINKLEDPHFIKTLAKHDILCVQETHCGPREFPNSHISTHKAIPICRKISPNNRYYGGMLLFIRKEIKEGVKVIYQENSNPEIIGLKLKSDFFDLTDDTFLWFVYAPPISSPYTKSINDIFDTLEQKLDSQRNNLIMGDLNGHTGVAPDFIDDATDNHSPINEIDFYSYDIPMKRNNVDNRAVDERGHTILEKCKNWNMRILNGRTHGDRIGEPTRYPTILPESPSTIDYALCSSGLLNKVQSFQVQPYEGNSDHACISTSLKTAYSIIDANNKNLKHREKIPRIPFNIDNLETYHQHLDQDLTLTHLETLVNKPLEVSNDTTEEKHDIQTRIDNIVESFNKLIITNAEKTSLKGRLRRKPGKTYSIKTKITHSTKWYNDECRKARNHLARNARKLRQNPFSRNLQQISISARNSYRRTCRKAEAAARDSFIQNLYKSNDAKSFWQLIKSMKDWGKPQVDPSDSVPPGEWEKYFKNLLNTSESKPFEIPDNVKMIGITDNEISEKEFQDALDKAKRGKANGPDRTIMEFLIYASKKVKDILLKILNIIFQHAIYPTPWTHNFLKAIFKKGDKENPGNYRGLAIGAAAAKLFSLILLGRLEAFVEDNDILSNNQIGFRKSYRTADHVYVLKTLVEKSVTRKGKKLYAAFIDFRKAYDTVNRTKLLKILSTIGIGRKLLLNIQSLYNKINYVIKTKDHKSVPIQSNLGLKQGCPLSPLLFNLYINDFDKYMSGLEDIDVNLQGEPITHFFYADDLVIVSDTKEGLQKKLDKLAQFSDEKDLTVNAEKSKIMIFNKRGRLLKESFNIKGEDLEVVQSFTYLGVKITASGSFTPAIKELSDKAKKAMMPLFKTIAQFKLPFKLAMKLFHTFIEPIAMYNAENWGCFTEKQIEKCKTNRNEIYDICMTSHVTRLQLKYYKYILGLNKHASNMAVFGETASLPLALKVHMTLLKYWHRLKSMDRKSLAKMAYRENVEINSNWCKTIQILNARYNLHAGYHNDEKYLERAHQKITNTFNFYWNKNIKDRDIEKKLEFYCQVKESFSQAEYLKLPCFKDRQRIAKFLCSDHHLEIEQGRYRGIPRNMRICTTCQNGAIEDEKHLLFDCPTYAEFRNKNEIPVQGNCIKELLKTKPSKLANFLAQAYRVRENRYSIKYINLTGMNLIISRVSNLIQEPTARPITKLQSTMIGGKRLGVKIFRCTPYKIVEGSHNGLLLKLKRN